jgi:small-conductance mechanosensitive channel
MMVATSFAEKFMIRTRLGQLCRFSLALTVLALGCCILALGQSASGGDAAAAPSDASVAPNSASQVLQHLNLVLEWSHQWDNADLYLSRPDDELYVQNGRRIAREVVNLEFQSALAQASLIGKASPSQSAPDAGSGQAISDLQNIKAFQQQIDGRIRQMNAALDAVNRKIAGAGTRDLASLLDQRGTLQGQLKLAHAVSDNLDKLAAFMTSTQNPGGATDLTEKILAMRQTALGAPVTAPKEAGKVQSVARAPVVDRSGNQGLIGQFRKMFRLLGSMRVLNRLEVDGSALQKATKTLRAPLVDALRSTLEQGQLALGSSNQAGTLPATQKAPAAAPPAQAPIDPQEKQRQMQDMFNRFKLLSSATMPLSQELVLVDRAQANLNQLEDALQHDYFAALRALLVRVFVILVALFLVWLFSWLWRRATFRYVRDTRRRTQFLLVRRLVTAFFMAIVIVLGFVSDFGSLATYVGLLTAGVAVALQAIILSIAAYFFVIGRYGIRVGDRITVTYSGANAIAGDVVDIGLVRFYLMELAGTGIDLQPTGRICVFPNSVLFSSNPLFKQIPGTEYAWREVALKLPADSDVEAAEKSLLAMAEKLYSTYRPQIERRHREIESSMDIVIELPKPYARKRFASTGPEVVVRYPIPLRQSAELDDRVVMEVTELLRKNPSIQLAPGTAPELTTPVTV